MDYSLPWLQDIYGIRLTILNQDKSSEVPAWVLDKERYKSYKQPEMGVLPIQTISFVPHTGGSFICFAKEKLIANSNPAVH